MATPRDRGPRPADGPAPGASEPQAAETEGPRTGFRYLLANPAFRLIWVAQVAAQLADKFLMFSLIILAYRLSHGSTPVAVTLLAYTVPAAAIAPPAGGFGDRPDRKPGMGSANAGRAGLIGPSPGASLVPG